MKRPTSLTLYAAATEQAVADTTAREITGLAVPYGPVGYSSVGAVTFGAGDIRLPDQLGRVKFLRQHDPDVVLGYASTVTDTPTGMHAALAVPASPAGDTALAEAADGRRDGLSVGVRLDADVLEQLAQKWWDGDTSPTAARGELVEISQVSLPAFSDARVDGSAALAASLEGDATALVTFTLPTPQSPVATPAPAHQEDHPMFTAAQLAALRAAGIDENDHTAARTYLNSLGLASAPEQVPPAGPAPAAAPPLGTAGTDTQVLSEPPVYTFDGHGPSLVRDAYNMRANGNTEAAARFSQFNDRLHAGDTRQGALLVAAVETRATAPNFINQGYRPELLLTAIDRGRPIISRVGTVNLTDATPFRVPIETSDLYKGTTVADGATTSGSATVTSATAAFTATDLGMPLVTTNVPAGSFIVKINSATSVNVSQKATATGTSQSFLIQRSAVGDHTEGQAHVTEGDLDIGEALFTPGAISGAYRLSRELVDATNPAIDTIALRAMARDYAKQTEGKAAAALAAAGPPVIASTNTLVKLRQVVASFFDNSDEAATYIASSIGYYNTLLAEVDTTNRPMLASVNPMNAAGTLQPGWTGVNIDATELFKSTRVTGDAAYIFNPDDILIGESSTQLFRFEETEGPGIIKLALWGYFGAKVLRNISVQGVSV